MLHLVDTVIHFYSFSKVVTFFNRLQKSSLVLWKKITSLAKFSIWIIMSISSNNYLTVYHPCEVSFWSKLRCLILWKNKLIKFSTLAATLLWEEVWSDENRRRLRRSEDWVDWHCVKSVQIRSFLWCVFSRIRIEYGDTEYLSVFNPNAGNYGPEKTPYLVTLLSYFAVSMILT